MAATLHPDQFPKRCHRCNAVHDALAWAALPLVGIQEIDGERTELRNCRCGSTLVVELEPERFSVVLPRRAHRAAVLIVERDQLAAMARVVEPPVHPAVALFEAARARAMGPRERCQPGRVSS